VNSGAPGRVAVYAPPVKRFVIFVFLSFYVFACLYILVGTGEGPPPPRLKPLELPSVSSGGGYVMSSRCELSYYDTKSLTLNHCG